MTSEERSLGILNHQSVDRLPLYDHVVNDAVIEYYSGEPLTVENGPRVVRLALDNLLDATRWIVFYPQKEDVRILPDGSFVKQKRWTSWHTQKEPMTVERAEKLLRSWLEDEANRDIEKSVMEFDAYVGSLVKLRDNFKNVFLFGNYMFKTGIMTYAYFGLEVFSYLMADCPGLVDDYIRIGNASRLEVIRKSKRAGEFPAIFMCDDIASKNGPLFSPAFLRKNFFPYLEQMVAAYRQHGVKFIYHSDGNLMPILDDLVAAGIDGLNPLETIAGMDIKEIRRRYPDLILIGGVDCSQLLAYGTPADVCRGTRQVMQEGVPWMFPGSSSEIHNNIPLDNVKAMVETVHEFTP